MPLPRNRNVAPLQQARYLSIRDPRDPPPPRLPIGCGNQLVSGGGNGEVVVSLVTQENPLVVVAQSPIHKLEKSKPLDFFHML
ncbi:hypothetical protein E5288_WYG022593 [Bos mutus]|uniref:Uncharacterized protein n=1 Tax=Bos mutus TaxID=72004 RepID=A0A6B0R4F9_9CETA|nr:hypothetical protein [Bos mutus]